MYVFPQLFGGTYYAPPLHLSQLTGREYIRYFEGGVSSVFLWDLEDGGFAGVVLLKKST